MIRQNPRSKNTPLPPQGGRKIEPDLSTPTNPRLIDVVKFSPEHLRAARGLLNWSREDLKKASGVSMETIKNIEGGIWKPNDDTHMKIVDTFAKHGVEFIWQAGFAKYGLKVGGVMRVVEEKEQDMDKVADELQEFIITEGAED